MAIEETLLKILACPQDKGPLLFIEDRGVLYNPRLKVAYAVRDDIPVMLVEESRQVTDTEHEELMGLVAARGIKPTFEPR